MKFSGKLDKMGYIRNPVTDKSKRKRKLSTTRKGKLFDGSGKELVFCGPNEYFIKRYRLNQHSHLMNWVNALLQNDTC